MKNRIPLNLALATSLAFANVAWAQESQDSHESHFYSAGHLSLEKAVRHARDPKSAINKLQKVLDKLCAPLDRSNEESERQRVISDHKFQNKLREELSRYSVRFSLGDLEELFNVKYLISGANYQYIVEPAFRNNEQVRKDVWAFKIGLATDTNVNLGVATTVRFTFSRFYGGKNAKWDAMSACPYFPTQTPMDSNDIKVKLRDGDGFRFEVIGNTSLNTEKVVDGNSVGRIHGGAKTEALFLMDLFKLNSQTVRTRLLGIKNKGEFSIGFTIRNNSPLDFVKGKLRDALTLGLSGSLRKTFSFFSLSEKYPIDTMMVDYLFKFSTPKEVNLDEIKDRTDIAEAAMEQLLSNIRKIGFASLFFSQPGENAEDDQKLGNRLLDKVKISEEIAKEDLEKYRRGEIEAKDMRVRSFFKGRMQSDLFAGEGNLWFSEVISKKGQIGNLDSFVTSYDENMKPSYYYLNNTFERGQTLKYLGREQYNFTHDFDVLIHSDKSREVGRISDIVLRTEVQDTDMDASDIEDIKNSLARSLPENFKNNPDFIKFFPTTYQTNAFLSHRYVFGHEAFSSIGQMDKAYLGQKIFEFLNTHPQRNKNMNLVVVNNQSDGNGLGTFAYEKAHEISNIVSANSSNKESMRAFKIARMDPLFEKYIVGEFFSSILPPETSEKLFGLNLKFTSRESGNPPAVNLGGKTVSPVYEAVMFLKAVISDPNLDMHLVSSTDSSGGEILIPASTNRTNLPVRLLRKD